MGSNCGLSCTNCVTSTSVGCLLCYKGCSVDKVQNMFTFLPPSPATYCVEADGQDKTRGKIRYLMEALDRAVLYRQAAEASEVRWLTTSRGNRIPIAWLHRHSVNKAWLHSNKAPSGSQPPTPPSESSQAPDPEVAVNGKELPSEAGPASPRDDLYSVLGIRCDAPVAEVNAAFKRQCIKHEQEKGPANVSEELSGAFKVLSDPQLRCVYDVYGLSGVKRFCSAHGISNRDSGEQATANSTGEQAPIVMLHCHGNAADLGTMMGPYYELAKILQIEVVGIEYSGYGSASGTPSWRDSCADLEAAYDHVTQMGVSPKRIVLYGSSVGSGPVLKLATKRQVGGIVLQGPMLSGIKIIDPPGGGCCRPSCVWGCFDFYPNDRLIRNVKCPTFIMHGQRDEIILFHHGYKLHKACPADKRWPAYFPACGGHNDLMETDLRTYFAEIGSFLQDLKKLASGVPVQPPPANRPRQVEMAPKVRTSEIMGARTAQVRSGEEAPATMSSAQRAPWAGAQQGDFIGLAPEPLTGPEDGRYEHMRRGNLLAGVRAAEGEPGEARGVRMAPTRPVLEERDFSAALQ